MLDVLVVGAGPTGLTLARQLQAFGCAFRIVDRHLDRAQESRAVAVQPRTLEVLAPLGATEQMLAHGNRAVAMSIHAGSGRVRSVPLFDLGLADTAYPFLLFLSQAETERILDELLRAGGATVERGVELVSQEASDAGVRATLRHPDGRVEHVEARYLAGCDGARSTVRQGAGIEFVGGAYPQTFVLADVEVDGIAPDCAHVFITRGGILFFFPLGIPATWRLLSMRRSGSSGSGPSGELTLAEVQSIVDSHAPGEGIRLRDPAWLTTFRLYHRRAARYRAGPVFLAGDAAHIHSPAGGQGMNIGIQDAVNLGWKLALGGPALLDSYQVEREPVGRDVLRFTDRAFTVATTTNPLVRMARAALVPLVLPLALRARWARAAAFRTVAELGIGYRGSPLAVDGPGAPRHGPRAGDRLPDAPVHRDGVPTSLHAAVSGPSFHLLVCSSGRISVGSGSPAVLDDADVALRRLGVPPGGAAVLLVRPDGHIAYCAGGTDPAGALALLARWVPGGDRPI